MSTAEAMRLMPGSSLTYWQVSETAEARYDVADSPMKGEMDPFFFLTKEKNFIPHEYPCRTRFAADHRGRRPEERGSFEAERNWLPFGARRLDLSGFWFRPTRLASWARTVVSAAAAGTARFRLATCGGAILFVNGKEAGHLSPYVRNLETAADFTAELAEGDNEILVFFDDLAERDTRYYIQLDWLAGPQASARLPFAAPEGAVRAVEACLSAMHFDKPAYTGGDVAVTLPRPLPKAAKASVTVEGDFMSHESLSLARDLAAGDATLPLGPADELPADFRHFNIALTMDGFTASRVLGVEIAHLSRQGAAPADLAGRIEEALAEVSEQGEPDTVCALARLASGRTGEKTEAMIERALPAIDDCWDCADFALVPLIWSRTRYGSDLSSALRGRIDEVIAGYRYWMDEPGNDVQWYFSENHALLFHTAAYLGGHLLPDTRFRRSGRLGREQSQVGAARVRAWLDHFEDWEMAEFNSAPYFPIDLKGLCALHALAPDADIAERAGRGILRLLEIVANSAHQGVLTAAQGRSYEHTLRAGLSLELSAIGRLVWGAGTYGARFHALPQLALCLRDHGLRLPAHLAERALWQKPTAQEWAFKQGEGGFAALYHYKGRDFALGSAAHYRWYDWGYQETLVHGRIGAEPQAQIWINHPGEVIHSGYGRPSYWGGSASVPRVQQYRGLAIVVFDGREEQPDFTHVWFPAAAFDSIIRDGALAAASSGEGRLLLRASDTLEDVTEGPSTGCELRLAGRKGRWLLRMGEAGDGRSLADLVNRFKDMNLEERDDGLILVEDPAYGTVAFHADGSIFAEGRRLNPSEWTVAGRREEFGSASQRE
ncbi:hypothetical protein H2509_14095 [Stappia sp. F7233]|uniref:Uncharacterized protein n=1 Tax=Stappia albiluteola TaxID=2758565 RepID=A0A839AGP1_9HYPH|nr:hypothetical protein [Stappia albiluteola]MBA5778256.1 hypothetical protein [Stappia albiluteola]